ncbi:MAG TPA: AIM24 family protein, partial [Vicinamibacterales bacterium]
MADEIDYQLIGDDLQAVIITLDPGEMVIAEAGAMMYMQEGIMMNTTLDPNATGAG